MTDQPVSRPRVQIYSDGGCEPNPGPGGWAAILIYTQDDRQVEKELSGGDPSTTNNRMELTAAVEALRALKKPCTVDFYTDSEYLQKGITQWITGWKRKGWRKSDGKPVLNVDLWQLLDDLRQQHDIRWHWVRGHAGNAYNERADVLATQARRRGGK